MTAVLEQPPTTAPAPDRARTSSGRFVVGWVLLSVAVLALFGVVFGTVLSGVQEHSSQRRLYSQLREQLAEATAPVSGEISHGHPVALLTVPELGLRSVVVEGTASRDLRLGPGHRRDTVLPGQEGVSVLYGRSVSYGHPFGEIASLTAEDTFTVVTGQGTFRYRVERVRRPGQPLPPAVKAGQSRLVLASYDATGWRSGWAPQQPVYVDALLIDKAQPAGIGRPQIDAAEELGGTDSGSLVVVVMWLQGLLLALVGLVWATHRWGRWQSWVAGLPVVLALLWGAVDAAAAGLPNVL